MASPMVEGRIDPHKKAHFTLHISDAIADGEVGDYTSVKYNHKPAQTTNKRATTLTSSSSSANGYRLTLEDEKAGENKDVFVFTGQKTVPKKSYILLFDPASQKATLEPLSSTYTFNIASKNGKDLSSTHSKIYPRKQKDDTTQDDAADDLFDENMGDTADGDPDPNNPYDFRHFLNAEKTKRGDESEYNFASSPDYRTGTGSATNTPQFTARKPAAAASKPKAAPRAAPKPKKRKSPEPERPVQKKAPPKKAPPPAVRLERRATDQKPARKAAAPPPSSKIKSKEIVHSSDESDIDAEGEPDIVSSPAAQRSPSPPPRHASPESDEDEEMEDVGITSGFEIEGEPRPSKSHNGALASLGLGQNIGLGYLNSPSNGPISLKSAANSVEGTPEPHTFTPNKSRSRNMGNGGVIDFGDLGGGDRSEDEEDAEGEAEPDDDVDVESINLGSPAQRTSVPAVSLDVEADADGEEEEEDPLLKEMMEGLAGGDSSEESEEE
ncbi:hypothetical protein N0V90_004652 [Kalmusia sp. IMI 367209]|nr:hypothetical protein N0V90_004652 [Kalmusia sp. IMI 367209]